MKHSWWTPCLGAVLCVLSASVLQAVSFERALIDTLEHAPSLEEARLKRQHWESKAAQEASAYWPQVAVDLGWAWVQDNNTDTRANGRGSRNATTLERSLTVDQMLIDGDKVRSKVAQASWQVRAQAHQIQNRTLGLAQELAEVYVGLRREAEQVAVLSDYLSEAQRVYQYIDYRVSNDLGVSSDLALAEAEVSTIASWREAQQVKAESYRNAFKALAGYQPNTETLLLPEIPLAFFPDNADQAVAMALVHHPALKRQHALLGAAHAGRQSAKADLGPEIKLHGAIRKDRNVKGLEGTDSTYRAGVRLHYNVFEGGKVLAQVQEQHIEVERARTHMLEQQRAIERVIRDAWYAHEEKVRHLPLLDQQIQAADRAWKGYFERYQRGGADLTQPLEALRRKWNAQMQRVVHTHDGILAQMHVLIHSGRFLAAYHLPEAEGQSYTHRPWPWANTQANPSS